MLIDFPRNKSRAYNSKLRSLQPRRVTAEAWDGAWATSRGMSKRVISRHALPSDKHVHALTTMIP
ncbi:hypothetical protein SNOG_10142 [Parastagonospora nodorum SN15]|uniref:Uncharacterized protein n=1 Tax=Phaeosphaeria nodorum (strain SN15 / ATCC MYA-4574 / FGSC 10173) TaxID=321614 RepID=Q0UDM2_PHANO|nr:hypothetical protein SNOG_10142 [Parastagonospora nodorum SN15]EAT82477.1 hypothetical protein SNOG_10142 [Parastagonospora nodorum SN15]